MLTQGELSGVRALRQTHIDCSTWITKAVSNEHRPNTYGRRAFSVAGAVATPAPQSRTLSLILSGTRPSVQTVSDVFLRRICLLEASALSALDVLDDYSAIQI